MAKPKTCESCKKVPIQWPRRRWCERCAGLERSARESLRSKLHYERLRWANGGRVCAYPDCTTDITNRGGRPKYCEPCSDKVRDTRTKDHNAKLREHTRLKKETEFKGCETCGTNINDLKTNSRYCISCAIQRSEERDAQHLADLREQTRINRGQKALCKHCGMRPIGEKRIKFCDQCAKNKAYANAALTSQAPSAIILQFPTPRRKEDRKIPGYYPLEEESKTNKYASPGDAF